MKTPIQAMSAYMLGFKEQKVADGFIFSVGDSVTALVRMINGCFRRAAFTL